MSSLSAAVAFAFVVAFATGCGHASAGPRLPVHVTDGPVRIGDLDTLAQSRTGPPGDSAGSEAEVLMSALCHGPQENDGSLILARRVRDRLYDAVVNGAECQNGAGAKTGDAELDSLVRSNAGKLLVAMGETEITPILLRYLQSESLEDRAVAVRSLGVSGQIVDTRIIRALIENLSWSVENDRRHFLAWNTRDALVGSASAATVEAISDELRSVREEDDRAFWTEALTDAELAAAAFEVAPVSIVEFRRFQVPCKSPHGEISWIKRYSEDAELVDLLCRTPGVHERDPTRHIVKLAAEARPELRKVLERGTSCSLLPWRPGSADADEERGLRIVTRANAAHLLLAARSPGIAERISAYLFGTKLEEVAIAVLSLRASAHITDRKTADRLVDLLAPCLHEPPSADDLEFSPCGLAKTIELTLEENRSGVVKKAVQRRMSASPELAADRAWQRLLEKVSRPRVSTPKHLIIRID